MSTPEEIAKMVLEGECTGGAALTGLPRFDASLGAVERDWSQLPPLLEECGDDGELCVPFMDDFLGDGFSIDAIFGGEPGTWMGVMQSYGMYAGLFIALGVISILFLLLRCITNLVCCVRRRVKKKSGAGDDDDGEEMTGRARAKAIWCQLMAVVSLTFFILFTLSLVFLSNKRGNLGVTETQKIFVTGAPVGTAQLINSLPSIAENAVSTVGGSSMPKVFAVLNGTLAGAINFGVVNDAFGCIERTLGAFDGSKLTGFLDMIDSVDAAISAFPDFDAVGAQLTSLNQVLSDLGPAIDSVKGFLEGLKASLEGIDLSGVNTALDQLNSTLAGELEPALSGLKASIQAMQTNMPTTTNVDATTLTLTTFRDDPTLTNADAVLGSMSALKTKLEGIPAGVDVEIKAVQGIFDQVVADLTGLIAVFSTAKDQIDALPGAAEVTATIEPLETLIASMNLSALKALLGELGTAIDLLPSDVSGSVSGLSALADDVPCIMRLKGELESVNRTLLELPPELGAITEQLDGLNNSISGSLSQLDAMTAVLEAVDTQLAALPDTSVFVTTIDDLEEQIDSAMSNLDASSQVAVIDESRAEVNMTEMIESMRALREELGEGNPVRINQTEIDDLAALNETRHDAIKSIDDATQLIEDWKTASPTFAPAAGVCTAGVNTGSGCGPTVSPAPCPEADCSWAEVAAGINAAISSFSTLSSALTSQPDFAGILTGIDSGLDSITNMPSMDTALITGLQTTIDDFVPSTDTYIAQMTSLRSELDAGVDSLDIGSTQTSLDTADSTLGSVAADLDGYRGIITDLNSTVGASDMMGMVTSVSSIVDSVHALLYGGGLMKELDRLSNGKVAAAIAAGGLEAGVLLVTSALDSILAPFMTLDLEGDDSSSSSSSSSGGGGGNFSMISDSIRNASYIFSALDAAGAAPAVAYEHGHLFFLIKVLASAGMGLDGVALDVSAVGAAAASEDKLATIEGVLGPEGLVAYPGDEICLTNECLMNSIEMYNTRPLPFVPVPLAREQLFSLLFVLPLLLVLLAVLAIVCLIRGRPCSGPFVVCGCAMAPLLFILLGGIFAPIVLIMGDVCNNLEPAAVSTVSIMQPTLCESMGGMFVSSTRGEFCVLAISETDNLELDIVETTRSILSRCEGLSLANLNPAAQTPAEPVAQLWARLKEVSDSMVLSQIKGALNGTALGPSMEDGLDQSIAELSVALGAIVDDAAGKIDCEALAQVLETVLEPLCCNVVDSLFWLVAPWLIISIMVVACAVPILCCSRRRKGVTLAAVIPKHSR